MRTILSLAIAGALAASPLAAQSTHRTETPCPLHLTTLALTPVQDSAFVAIRAAHKAEMRAVHARLGVERQTMHARHADHAAAKHDSAAHAAHAPAREAMKASMARTIESARAVLTDAQRARFDQAVTAHEAEKQALAAKGIAHECGDCCEEHAGHPAKKE